ncbi:MAG: LPS export ABC transporter permease LptG [Candidatus Rokuibacteriota bacterium]
MLRIVDRYVLKELGPPFAVGVAVFTFFLLIDRVYSLTDLVITKGVPFHLVLFLLVFILPAFLTQALPIALLVAVLLVCGRLAADLEITAFKASGVSPLRLFRPVVAAAVLVSLAAASLTLVVAPWAQGMFQRQLFRILQTRAATGITERTFSASFGQFTLYVQDVSPSQVALKGLIVSDERDPALLRVIVAREGRLLTDEENKRVTLRFLDGEVTETDPVTRRRFRHTVFTLYDMNLPLESPLSSASKAEKPERDLPSTELLGQARALAAEGQKVTPYYVEFHKRVSLPFAAIVFVIIGFPLGVRSQRAGRGVAIATSLGIVLSYYFVMTSVENMAHSGRVPAGLGMWAPNILFGAVGLVMLRLSLKGVRLPGGRVFWVAWENVREWRPPAPRGWTARFGGLLRLPRRRASSFIIDRYLMREYAKFLGIAAAVGVVLLATVDLLLVLDRFLRVKPPLTYILQHFLFRLPGLLYGGLPVIVLIATVFLFLSLTRQRELDALKAAGISLYRVCLPVLVIAAGLSVGSVLFQEAALPGINARADEVDRVKIRGQKPKHLQQRSQIWYRSSDTRFFRLQLLDPAEQSIEGLLLLEVDANFRLVSRLDARKVRWTPQGWELADGAYREVVGRTLEAMPFTLTVVQMPETIEDFSQLQKPPDTMSFLELRSYVRNLQESGHQVRKHLVELYAKLSFPLVHVIMALVAIPFALLSPRSGGRAVGIGVAVAIAAGYWIVNAMALSFAKADLLPPMLAAWTANIVFLGLGAVLFLRART